jgi:flagellar M-ring protein FliF
VNYQRALEGELERSIQTLKDVDSVRVHLVLPTDSVFVDRERKAKASVILKLRTGRLPEETQQGIARLVSGAVDKLDPDDVTVIDADTNRPLGQRRDAYAAGGGMEQELSAQLLQTLEPVVGPQHVRARVNVEYDPSTAEENAETYDPKSAVVVSEQKSEEQVGGGISGGVPGTTSNVPGGTAAANTTANNAKPDPNSKTDTTAKASTPTTNVNTSNRVVADSEDGMQISRSESNSYVVSRVSRHVLQPAGRIRRISAALLVDDAVEIKQEGGKKQEIR